MFEFLIRQNPVFLGFLGTVFTWFLTAIGSASVLFFKKVNDKILDAMLGFAAGVMIAASFFSLIAPGIEISIDLGYIKWLPAVFGFLLGAFFIYLIDVFIPDIDKIKFLDKDLIKNGKNEFMLFTAVTLHNLPEGLAIGVAFGALANNPSYKVLIDAMVLSLGIGIQNMPEGAAISIPLRRNKVSLLKSFNYGQMSALIEIIGGVLGAYAVMTFTKILPFALSFAAGAMIYVSIEEIIPEAKRKDFDNKTSTIFGIIGFALMMFLDLALS